MKKIIAEIPARKSWDGKQNLAAETKTFTQDDAGRWTMDFCGKPVSLFESEVIDICKDAKNWKEIKLIHFPMHGFHN